MKKIKILLVAFLLVAGLLFGTNIIDSPEENEKEIISKPVPTERVNITSGSFSDLYNSIKGGTVTVYTGGLSNTDNNRAQGSGFIFDSNGHIVTNEHVLSSGSGTIYIKYSDGTWSGAEVVGTDRRTDLAVLEPKKVPKTAYALPVSKKVPKRGTKVVAFGSPENLENSITRGIISGNNRTMESQTGHVIPDTIQSDATLSVGNSGGPLINKRGVIVGVNRAKQGDTVSLAVSPRIVNEVVPSLIEKGSYNHSFVGIRMRNVNPAITSKNDYIDENKGVMVVGTVAGSPGDSVFEGGTDTGVPTGGDVILKIEGKEVRGTEHLSSILMLRHNPGDRVRVLINRGGEEKFVTLELGKQR